MISISERTRSRSTNRKMNEAARVIPVPTFGGGLNSPWYLTANPGRMSGKS